MKKSNIPWCESGQLIFRAQGADSLINKGGCKGRTWLFKVNKEGYHDKIE